MPSALDVYNLPLTPRFCRTRRCGLRHRATVVCRSRSCSSHRRTPDAPCRQSVKADTNLSERDVKRQNCVKSKQSKQVVSKKSFLVFEFEFCHEGCGTSQKRFNCEGGQEREREGVGAMEAANWRAYIEECVLWTLPSHLLFIHVHPSRN